MIKNIPSFRRGCYGQAHFSSFTSRSRGVVSLTKKGVPLQSVEVAKDTRGRYVILKGLLHGEEIAFMNIYWPPGHPSIFLTEAFAKLADWGVKTFIYRG